MGAFMTGKLIPEYSFTRCESKAIKLRIISLLHTYGVKVYEPTLLDEEDDNYPNLIILASFVCGLSSGGTGNLWSQQKELSNYQFLKAFGINFNYTLDGNRIIELDKKIIRTEKYFYKDLTNE